MKKLPDQMMLGVFYVEWNSPWFANTFIRETKEENDAKQSS